MKITILALLFCFGLLAGPADAADMPRTFKKCKMCHGLPGANKPKMGPDLATNQWAVEDWVKIVTLGSKFEPRPPKQEKYAKKKMPKQKKLTADDVKAIYEYVQAAK